MDKLNFNEVPYDLIISELDGSISEQEKMILYSWINESAINKSRYMEAVELIGKMDLLDEYKRVSADKALERLYGRHSLQEVKTGKTKKRIWKIPTAKRWMIAAAVILLAMITVLLEYKPSIGHKSVITQNGKELRTELPDGTMIVLGENSEISYDARNFTQKRILNIFQGKIYLEIAPQTGANTFEIHAGELRVKDIGTSFEVHMGTDLVEVQVSSGRVAMYNAEKPDLKQLVIGEREKGTYDRKRISLTSTVIDDPNFESWHSKKIRYTGEKLEKIARDLETIYHVKIDFADEKIGDRTWGGYFDNGEVKDILQTIAKTLDLKVQQKTDGYVFKYSDDPEK